MSYLPTDPVILLSYINTKLRDEYSSLDDFCNDNDCSKSELIERLKSINFSYNPDLNQFK
jgi:hypothetical protein